MFREKLGMHHFEIIQVVRLGKKRDDDKPRPLLIRLGSEKEKWSILGRSKNLRNSSKYGNIYIARDMTKEERKDDFTLRQDLKKKKERGDNSWVIKNGKVIKKNDTSRNFIPSRYKGRIK